MNRSVLIAIFSLFVLVMPAYGEDHSGAVHVVSASLKPPLLEGRPGVGYMVLRNETGADDALVAAAVPGIERIELHTHEHADGVMRMRRVEQVPVPAGETVNFEPGGLHLMLFGVGAEVKSGGTVPLTLTFETAGQVTVEAEVR